MLPSFLNRARTQIFCGQPFMLTAQGIWDATGGRMKIRVPGAVGDVSPNHRIQSGIPFGGDSIVANTGRSGKTASTVAGIRLALGHCGMETVDATMGGT
jgi:hypothetical protein